MPNSIHDVDNSVLMKLISLDGREELSKRLVDIISEEVECQLRESDSYIINPYELDDLYEQIVSEVKEEIKDKWKSKIMAYADKKMETAFGKLNIEKNLVYRVYCYDKDGFFLWHEDFKREDEAERYSSFVKKTIEEVDKCKIFPLEC